MNYKMKIVFIREFVDIVAFVIQILIKEWKSLPIHFEE